MDLDEMLRVDRCRDMDELINFLSPIRIMVGCRNRTAFSTIVFALLGVFCRCTASRDFKMVYGPPLGIGIGRPSQ